MSVVINGGVGVTFPDSVTQTSGVPSPGTNGNVLTSNGTIWVSQAAAAFDAGTRMMFAQTSAPTGWTKDTTNYNNYALRVVTGAASTGGSVDFTTAFASQAVSGSIGNTTATGTVGSTGAYTLSTSEIPSHTHTLTAMSDGGTYIPVDGGSAYPFPRTITTNATGGGGSHSHSGGSFTGTAHNHTFTGTAINMAVKYLDVITATKN